MQNTHCNSSLVYRCFTWALGAELAHTYQAMIISLLANRCFSIRSSQDCSWKVVPSTSNRRSYSTFFQPFWGENSTAYGPGMLDDVLEEIPFDIDELVLSKAPELRIALRSEVTILSKLKWEDGASEMLMQNNELYRDAFPNTTWPAKKFLHGGIMRYLWRPRLWLQHEGRCRLLELNLRTGQYVGVHIRRGDKVSGGAKEAEAVPTDRYIDQAVYFLSRNRALTAVYVASDTQAVVEEFCRMLAERFVAINSSAAVPCFYDRRELRMGGWIPFFEDRNLTDSHIATASRVLLACAITVLELSTSRELLL